MYPMNFEKGVLWGLYKPFGMLLGGIARNIISALNAAGRSSRTGSTQSIVVRRADNVLTARKERQGKVVEASHSEKARMKMRMAMDCLERACDGVLSESWPYVMDQLGKASINTSEACFLADTAKLLHERSVIETLRRGGRRCGP